MERREYLKPSRFGNIEKRRILNTKNLKDTRSIRRTTNFNLRRNFEDVAEEIKENITKNVSAIKDPVLDRKLALQKFRAERDFKKRTLNDKRKPPFVVGIPHHGSSPILKNLRAENNCRRTTKTTATQEFSFQPQKIQQSVKKLTSPHTPTVLKRSVQKKPLKSVSNVVIKGSPKNTHGHDDGDEVLAAPLPKSVDESQRQAVGGSQAPNKRSKVSKNLSPPLNEDVHILKVEEKEEDEVVKKKDENHELSEEVAFQHNRLQAETTRLQELADLWQTVVVHESLPQEVVDEVDSVVGQTRLLTSDKFQQFHRLIVQFENRTGTHPVTLDDLNGFWDMVYLQVESLDKKYTSLNILKNNSWVYPEPATKNKRRPAKKLAVNKVPETSTTPEKAEKQNSLQVPEDQQIQTPTTDRKSVISSVLLNRNRTRSNSPSPYITMRLSGVGRTSSILAHSPKTDGTPRSILVSSTEVQGMPKSALKKSLTRLSESARKRTSILSTIFSFETKIEEAVEETNYLKDADKLFMPTITPRRSMRLMTKQSTPATCSVCDSISCDKSMCIPSIPRSSSKRSRKSQNTAMTPVEGLEQTMTKSDSIKDSASKSTRRSKTILTFSPSGNQHKGDCATVIDVNKPSTSGIRFSLRPSILTVRENNNCENPKKTKKRRAASVFSPSATNAGLVAEEPTEAMSRRSTRQSRRVTFVSGAEEKTSFKLPATPFRKSQADS